MPRGSTRIPIKVPTLGERNDIPEHELPLEAMRLAQNMIRNDQGRLALRPGYTELVATGPTGRIVGVHHFQTAAGGGQDGCC